MRTETSDAVTPRFDAIRSKEQTKPPIDGERAGEDRHSSPQHFLLAPEIAIAQPHRCCGVDPCENAQHRDDVGLERTSEKRVRAREAEGQTRTGTRQAHELEHFVGGVRHGAVDRTGQHPEQDREYCEREAREAKPVPSLHDPVESWLKCGTEEPSRKSEQRHLHKYVANQGGLKPGSGEQQNRCHDQGCPGRRAECGFCRTPAHPCPRIAVRTCASSPISKIATSLPRRSTTWSATLCTKP